MDHAARTEGLAESPAVGHHHVARVVLVLRVLLGVEVVQVAEELTEAVRCGCGQVFISIIGVAPECGAGLPLLEQCAVTDRRRQVRNRWIMIRATRCASDSAYHEAFRTLLEASCTDIASVNVVIVQAISAGAPIYNEGSHLGCYRIYEGAAYKLLFLLDGECEPVEAILQAGLTQAAADGSATEKAWTMRRTFDLILGEPTVYK